MNQKALLPSVFAPEHVSRVERERSWERSSIHSAPLAQPKMLFGNLLVPESVE